MLLSASEPSSSNTDVFGKIAGASKDVKSAASSQQNATQGARLDSALVALAHATGGEGLVSSPESRESCVHRRRARYTAWRAGAMHAYIIIYNTHPGGPSDCRPAADLLWHAGLTGGSGVVVSPCTALHCLIACARMSLQAARPLIACLRWST